MTSPNRAPQPPWWSQWWLVAFVPLLAFAPSIFLEYGLRDDYSILREVKEEPGKLVAFCASQGRLIYGLLLRASFSLLGGVSTLAFGRLLGVVLVGLVGAVVARTLIRRFDWAPIGAVTIGALLTLLPAPQVIVTWAICWPHAFAAVLGITAFSLAERGMSRSQGRTTLIAAAIVTLIAGLLTYQSNALVYTIPLVAGWLHASRPRTVRWLVAHLTLVAGALGATFGLTHLLVRILGYQLSDRVAIDWDVMGKLAWFFDKPWKEALGLYLLRDQMGRTEPYFSLVQIVTMLAIVTALLTATRLRDVPKVVAGWVVIVAAAYAVSFVANERWAAYRTLWPITGVVLVTTALGVYRWAVAVDGFLRRPALLAQPLMAGAMVALVLLSAGWDARRLIAAPQALEWAKMREIAEDFNPNVGGRVFVVLPRSFDTPSPVRHLDEFGSLTADTDWAAKEMFRHALQAEYPQVPSPAARLVWQSGYVAPTGGQLAQIVDFRETEPSPWLPGVVQPRTHPREVAQPAARPVFR